MILTWRTVAPSPTSKTKPNVDLTDRASYSWGEYDALLTAAAQRGWKVLLTVSGPVPKWATNKRKDTSPTPSPSEFQAFMTAVGQALRPAGGHVVRSGTSPTTPTSCCRSIDRKHHAVSGRMYRQLFLAAWRALRATGNGTKPLLMGETAPRGTSHVVAPLAFLRGAVPGRPLPALGKCTNLPADGYAHHSYSTREGPFFRPGNPDDVTMGVVGRLNRALRVRRAGRRRARRPADLPRRVRRADLPRIGCSASRSGQPQYYAISEKLAYDNPRVASFSQYLLRDDVDQGRAAASSQRFPASSPACAAGQRQGEAGLQRLPPAARRHPGPAPASLWGLVRPATGPTQIQLRATETAAGAR